MDDRDDIYIIDKVDNVDNIEEGGLKKVKKVETNHKEISSEGEEWMASLRLKVEGEQGSTKLLSLLSEITETPNSHGNLSLDFTRKKLRKCIF